MTGVTNKTAGAVAYQGFNETYQTLRAIADKYSDLVSKLSRESGNLSKTGQEAMRELLNLETELIDLREAVMWREIMFRPEIGELKR